MPKMPMTTLGKLATGLAQALVTLCAFSGVASASLFGDEPKYVTAPSAPKSQTDEEMRAKTEGCQTCHTQTDSNTMHLNPAVKLGCTDCHGGDANVRLNPNVLRGTKDYMKQQELAHVLPKFPEEWKYPSSANPERTYTLLNRESPEFIRFINPSDYRIVRESCGACHMEIIEASARSMHTTGAMLWGGAAYNNGILDFKQYILGESYDRNSQGVLLKGPKIPDHLVDQAAIAGILPQLYPLPSWETIYPGDIFRVFERGGRNIVNLFPETGIPNALGQLQRIEEPGGLISVSRIAARAPVPALPCR